MPDTPTTRQPLLVHRDHRRDFENNLYVYAVVSRRSKGVSIGVNLNQPNGSTTKSTFAATGAGVAYTLSSLPTPGTRLIIDNAGADYCANLTAATGTIPWSGQ